jgi:hypothetical protein
MPPLHSSRIDGHFGMHPGYYFAPDPRPYNLRSSQYGLMNELVVAQPGGYYPGCSLGDSSGNWGYLQGFQPWPHHAGQGSNHMAQLQAN